MARRTSRIRSSKLAVNCDLELRPLMNVFIVLIPMLLMSAVFIEIRVIEMSLPRAAASAANVRPAAAPLELALHVQGQAYVLVGNGIAALSFPRVAVAGRDGAPDKATAARLAQALAGVASAHPGNREIKIVAEAQTRYQEIVTLMDLARAAGLPEVGLEGARMEGV